jgi:hypothetical protein
MCIWCESAVDRVVAVDSARRGVHLRGPAMGGLPFVIPVARV